MCFQDRPFPENTPLFPPHTDVFDYLNNLVKSEDLQSFVRYSTLVEKVEFENDVWKVSVFSKGERYTEEFDALVVATGHYTVPYIPAIPGLAELDVNKRIEIQHARDYRQPQEFANKVYKNNKFSLSALTGIPDYFGCRWWFFCHRYC